MPDDRTIFLATRGSALALAQADLVLGQCRAAFPGLRFDLRVIKTTGDKFETASLSQERASLPKGLFTKELEVALLTGEADLAVHSLKDLPTELPQGLELGAVTERADVRDMLICRADNLGSERISIENLRPNAIVGTSSTRRRAQLLARRQDLKIVELRGNILTRLQKLSCNQDMDALVLAAAGLKRLGFRIAVNGRLAGGTISQSLSAVALDPDLMLPCVGQGALGIEVRRNDERIAAICKRLDHFNTRVCVTAERAFLAAMGGGCASPVAAYAEIIDDDVQMRAISFHDGFIRRAAGKRERQKSVDLGRQLAEALKDETPGSRCPGGPPDSSATYAAREFSTGI